MSLAVVLGFSVLSETHAAFNGLVPLAHTGQLSYNYNYVENAGGQSESTSLLLGWNASGYIWRPWFASTSLALNVGLSSTQSTASSTEGTVGAGSFSLGVFPSSRFPFSMSYTKTDSRSQQFQDISQVSGSTSFRVTRLTLRQSYRPRAYNQMYNGWFSSTQFEGNAFASDSEIFGLDYQLRVPRQILSVSAAHSATKVKAVSVGTDSDVIAVNHVYTPSAELGVNSALSYVQADPGGTSPVSIGSQAFSSFYWRPEHRALSVSGGVRLNETKSEGLASTTTSRGLNTNLGLNYRISRSLNMNAGASLGTSDGGSVQTLSTSQAAGLSYSGGHRQWKGYSYSWQWSASASNVSTQTESAGIATTNNSQNIASGIGHSLGKSWSAGSASSLAATFSQSVSGSKNSEVDVAATSLNHGASMSWSSRGGRGSSYISARVNDSRSYGVRDTVFDSFSLNYSADTSFGRLSSMSGNANFQASRSEAEGDAGGLVESSSKGVSGSLSYRNTRPFGVYNLIFTSSLVANKQLDSLTPSTTVRWEGVFRYNLGLLATSLGFRASESAGGNITKSMNFQATRSF